MSEKSLFTHISEAFDTYQTERRSRRAAQTDTHANQRTRFRRWLPTPGNILFTLLTLGSLLWAQNAGAFSLLAAPNAANASTGTIAYQGRLADSAGNPLTDTVNMSFRLYAAASGGEPLWEEQWTGTNSVNVSDGLFNVMLGSVNSIGQAVITGNSNLFLGITVGTDGEMSPRVQLGSVPFATQALTVPDGSITAAKVAGGAITQAAAPFAPITYWGSDSNPDANMKSAIITTVFDPEGANSQDVNISAIGFTNRPLGICQISDTSDAVGSYICAYSWDDSSNTNAVIRIYPQDGTGMGPMHILRITLFLMGS